MTQYARPSSDITTGWTTTPLWSKIDEVTPSDADFITGTGPSVTAEVLLSAVSDPLSSSGHTWNVRLKATGSSGAERVSLYLYQGATLIATLISNASVGRSAFVHSSGTLSGAEADSISDYSDLRFRLVTGNNGASETIQCSFSVFEVPDASSIYNESLSLAQSKSVSEGNASSLAGGVSLGKSASLSDNNLSAINAAVSAIQKALGVSESVAASIQSAVSLAMSSGIQSSIATARTFEEALSLAKSLSQVGGNASILDVAYALPRALGISEAVVPNFATSIILGLAKLSSLQPNLVSNASASLNTVRLLTGASEKVFVSTLSLGKLDGVSAQPQVDSSPSLPINISLSISESGLAGVLAGVDLSRVSSIVVLGGHDISVSTILSKLSQVVSDGSLGIAIIYGSVIIIDTQLAKALVSDSRLYRVEVRDESA